MKDNLIQNIYKLNDDIKNRIYDYFIHFQFIEKKKINNHILNFFYAKKLLKSYNYKNIINAYNFNSIIYTSNIDNYHHNTDDDDDTY